MEEFETQDIITVAFQGIEDPRVERTKAYSLPEILFLCLCAVLTGVKSWRGVAEFGEDKLDFLRKYLPYENGTPCHQTIGRVMSLIKPSCFLKAYGEFLSEYFQVSSSKLVALDGKTLRKSFDKTNKTPAIKTLNAWCVENGLCLGHLKIPEGTNEITTIEDFLEFLHIEGAIVTTDALNTQKSIAKKIVEKKANYALPIKGNHKHLQQDIKLAFDTQKIPLENLIEKTEKGHGRIETREFSILPAPKNIDFTEWQGLTAIGKYKTTVIKGEKETQEERYYLLSFLNLEEFATAARKHWHVENALHWTLDVVFREDDCRVRKDYAPDNFSTIRKLALNILRNETAHKSSVPRKMARASRKEDYLELLLTPNKT